LTAFSADQAVQKLYQVSSFKNSLANLFGDRVLILKNEGGELEVDRAWLRDHVLPFPEARRALEGCVHGRVLEMLEVTCDCARNAGEKVFVAEVPLHYEIGQVISADLVIVVAASRSVQVRRMMENRGLDEATAQAFLNAQWPIEAKVEKADVVIWNDGDPSALECQTLLLANLLNLE
jgi:dephospho-CoA kinase